MNRLGIKNVEIWTGPMHFYVDYNKNQSVEQLKEYAKKYDVKNHWYLSRTNKSKAKQCG